MLNLFDDDGASTLGQYEANEGNKQGATMRESQVFLFRQPFGTIPNHGAAPQGRSVSGGSVGVFRASLGSVKAWARPPGLPRLAAGNRSRNVVREPDRNERERPGTELRNRAAGTKRERPCGSAEGSCLAQPDVADAATDTDPVAETTGHTRGPAGASDSVARRGRETRLQEPKGS
jgi:hypothetical protein